MAQFEWRALLGKSTCLFVVALAMGCTSATPTVEHPSSIVSLPASPQAVPAAAEPMLVVDSGPTALERIAQATQALEAERRRSAQLARQVADEKARSAELEERLAQQTQAADRLRRQLADLEQAIEDVRAEATAAEGLRPQMLVLKAQLDATQAELAARKKELLQLTLKLEDIYRVLIREFESRSAMREAGEFVVRPQ